MQAQAAQVGEGQGLAPDGGGVCAESGALEAAGGEERGRKN